MAAVNLGRTSRKSPAAIDAPLAPGALVPGATPGAQPGVEHVEAPTQYDAILLAGFGGPEGQDDVIPFLRNVTRGRGIPDERLEEVAHHYRHYDGVSPINAQNRALKAALEERLSARGVDLPVYWGNRNWEPYMGDAVRAAYDDGHRRLLAIATSAYSSYSSCRQYREDFADALADTGVADEIQIDKVRQFFDHPGFVSPFIDGVREALDGLRVQLSDLDVAHEVEVLFTTHSIPSTDAAASGPAERDLGPEGAYVAQHLAVAETVMAAQSGPRPGWQLVYQSRSGPASMPWLEPDINDVIRALPTRGIRAVLIVPIGFVSDHMEVLWDLDNEAAETARASDVVCVRVPTPGVQPDYVNGLVDLVLERVNGTAAADRPAVTELGPWYDVCRPGCCENTRLGFKPALAGIAP